MQNDDKHHPAISRHGLEELCQRLNTARRAAQSDHRRQLIAVCRNDVVEPDLGLDKIRRHRWQTIVTIFELTVGLVWRGHFWFVSVYALEKICPELTTIPKARSRVP